MPLNEALLAGLRKDHPVALDKILAMGDSEMVQNFYHLCQSNYQVQYMTERDIVKILKKEFLNQMVEELAGDMRAVKQHRDMTR